MARSQNPLNTEGALKQEKRQKSLGIAKVFKFPVSRHFLYSRDFASFAVRIQVQMGKK